MPVPASSTMQVSSASRTSTHTLLPPYRTVDGPGVGVEPRTPWKRTRMAHCTLPVRRDPIHFRFHTYGARHLLHGSLHPWGRSPEPGIAGGRSPKLSHDLHVGRGSLACGSVMLAGTYFR